MKSKKLILVFIILIYILIKSINVYAVLIDYKIEGDKTVEINGTIQMKAKYVFGNDISFPDEPNRGIVRNDSDVTSKSSWISSNNDIATVDSTGKVTGIAEGTTNITAKYEGLTANYEITVKSGTDVPTTEKIVQQIGKNYIIAVIVILLVISLVIIIYAKFKKRKG